MNPCKKCGLTDRYKSGQCRACRIAKGSAWQKSNPEKANSISKKYESSENRKSWKKKYRSKNSEKEKSRAKARKYYAENTEKAKAATKKWSSVNPEERRIYDQNKRARRGESGGKLSKGLAEKLFKLQRGKCACCSKPLGNDYHLDHRMPLALGGENEDSNMQLLTARCNMQKWAKHPVDFMQSRGFLL